MNEARIITLANQKGGCGKTAMTTELGAALVRKGYRVLGVDMDPQGNLSEGARASIGKDLPIDFPSMYDILKGTCHVTDALVRSKTPDSMFDILPANIYLASAEQEVASRIGREYIIKTALSPIMNEYDFIVLDTPPSLGTLTINAFAAADDVIIPIIPDIYAVGAMVKLKESIDTVKSLCNPKLDIAGVLLTQFDSISNNSATLRQIVDNISEILGVNVFDSMIRKAVALPSARMVRMTLSEYAKSQKLKKPPVLADIEEFVAEYLELIRKES